MKSFTAKQLSRAPHQVFESVRQDGKAEITHDRYNGKFEIYYLPENANTLEDGAVIEIAGQKLRVLPWKEIK